MTKHRAAPRRMFDPLEVQAVGVMFVAVVVSFVVAAMW